MGKLPAMMPSLLDREISSTHDDEFGHRHYAKALESLIESPGNRPPFSIGLLGRWGTGKSSIKSVYLSELADDRTKPANWADAQDWGSGTFTQTDKHPVLGTSYYEAEAFCVWAGGHLPTEAQWEKAARWDGHPRAYPWGNTWNAENCNNYDDTNPAGGGIHRRQTSPVGSYAGDVSPYGCYDMAGNVWEWVKDWFEGDYYAQTPPGGWIDPEGPESYYDRVYRGGCWSYMIGSSSYRCASRGYLVPGYNANYGGFRLSR